MNVENKSFGTLTGNVSKIAAPVGGFLGTLSDIFSPLAPFAPIILGLSFISFLYFYFRRVRPALKSDDKHLVYSDKPAQIAGFCLITSIIMLIFWGITSQYPDEGAIAGNFDGVKQLQNQILGRLDDISDKQTKILASQEDVASDVKQIKDYVTGDAEIKNLSSTKDYSIIKDENKNFNFSNSQTIAILYFDNGSNNIQLDPLRKGLADILISDLSNLKMLRVVERDKLEEILKEQNLSNSKGFNVATQQKIGRLLGAEMILFGSYFEVMGTFRIDARIVKTETGEILKSEGVNGKTNNFMKLEKQLVWKLAKGLNVRFTEKEENAIMATESISYEATLAYAKGLELFDKGDLEEALKKFNESLKLSPDFKNAQIMINKLINS